MITIYLKNYNREITQKKYDEVIKELSFNTLTCPLCKGHHFVKHAYYSRKVKTKYSYLDLVILRVKCKTCNSTHALLLSCIIPYSSIQLKDQLRIIKGKNIDELMLTNINIDESDVQRVKRNYRKFFKEMLFSFDIALNRELIINCFKYFRRNFLQIKWGYNILYT